LTVFRDFGFIEAGGVPDAEIPKHRKAGSLFFGFW